MMFSLYIRTPHVSWSLLSSFPVSQLPWFRNYKSHNTQSLMRNYYKMCVCFLHLQQRKTNTRSSLHIVLQHRVSSVCYPRASQMLHQRIISHELTISNVANIHRPAVVVMRPDSIRYPIRSTYTLVRSRFKC